MNNEGSFCKLISTLRIQLQLLCYFLICFVSEQTCSLILKVFHLMKSVHLNSSIYSFVQANGDAWAKCFVNFVIRIQRRKVPNFGLVHNRSLHGSIPMFYQIIYLFLRPEPYCCSGFLHEKTLKISTARCHGRTHYRGNIILASGNQKYPMSQTTWSTSSHMAYFTMSWETLTMCWETWCSIDLNTIKFNGLYKHRCEVVKLWFSKTWWSMPCVMR